MVGRLGQLKIQQMVFMLLGVTFLFILVGMIFLGVRFNALKKSASILEEENALLLVSKLANSAEFSCGNSFGGSRTNCIDSDKVFALKEKIKLYEDFWGVAKIEMRRVYPERNIVCSQENYPDCDVINLLDKKVDSSPAFSNFVVLCRKELSARELYDKCELARLLISSEVKA